MISLIKIDDRLLHGQIVYSWARYLDIDRIIVANDEVVTNELKIMTLRMSIPSNIICSILCVKDAIEILNDERCGELKILLVIDSAKDAVRIIKNIIDVPIVNVSTYGRKMVNKKETNELLENVFLTREDIVDFKYLTNMGVKMEYRNVPSEKSVDFGQVIEKLDI